MKTCVHLLDICTSFVVLLFVVAVMFFRLLLDRASAACATYVTDAGSNKTEVDESNAVNAARSTCHGHILNQERGACF